MCTRLHECASSKAIGSPNRAKVRIPRCAPRVRLPRKTGLLEAELRALRTSSKSPGCVRSFRPWSEAWAAPPLLGAPATRQHSMCRRFESDTPPLTEIAQLVEQWNDLASRHRLVPRATHPYSRRSARPIARDSCGDRSRRARSTEEGQRKRRPPSSPSPRSPPRTLVTRAAGDRARSRNAHFPPKRATRGVLLTEGCGLSAPLSSAPQWRGARVFRLHSEVDRKPTASAGGNETCSSPSRSR